MKAVIISAGEGSRLNLEKSKPLTPLLGCSLIERVILSAIKGGIREFVVVTGYKGELLESNLGDGEEFGVDIQCNGCPMDRCRHSKRFSRSRKDVIDIVEKGNRRDSSKSS